MEHPVMGPGELLRRRRERLIGVADPAGSDAGFSLMETIVGMAIMAIFMSLFTSALLSMFNAANKASTVNQTASQLNIAFGRLDKQVRYAAAISPEGQSGGAWYVEFLTTNTGTDICSQLKLDPTTQLLQERTWTVPSAGAAVASGWSQLANNVTNGGQSSTSPDRPFQFIATSGAARFEQLTIRLFAEQRSNNSTTSSVSSVTFTALNSTTVTPTTGICTQVSRS
jgi:prepilin-type N-terminal cleavage/methylation domain-containing protein